MMLPLLFVVVGGLTKAFPSLLDHLAEPDDTNPSSDQSEVVAQTPEVDSRPFGSPCHSVGDWDDKPVAQGFIEDPLKTIVDILRDIKSPAREMTYWESTDPCPGYIDEMSYQHGSILFQELGDDESEEPALDLSYILKDADLALELTVTTDPAIETTKDLTPNDEAASSNGTKLDEALIDAQKPSVDAQLTDLPKSTVNDDLPAKDPVAASVEGQHNQDLKSPRTTDSNDQPKRKVSFSDLTGLVGTYSTPLSSPAGSTKPGGLHGRQFSYTESEYSAITATTSSASASDTIVAIPAEHNMTKFMFESPFTCPSIHRCNSNEVINRLDDMTERLDDIRRVLTNERSISHRYTRRFSTPIPKSSSSNALNKSTGPSRPAKSPLPRNDGWKSATSRLSDVLKAARRQMAVPSVIKKNRSPPTSSCSTTRDGKSTIAASGRRPVTDPVAQTKSRSRSGGMVVQAPPARWK